MILGCTHILEHVLLSGLLEEDGETRVAILGHLTYSAVVVCIIRGIDWLAVLHQITLYETACGTHTVVASLNRHLNAVCKTKTLAVFAPEKHLRSARHVERAPDIEVGILGITFLLWNDTSVGDELSLILFSHYLGSLGCSLEEILGLLLDATCRILIAGIVVLACARPSLS